MYTRPLAFVLVATALRLVDIEREELVFLIGAVVALTIPDSRWSPYGFAATVGLWGACAHHAQPFGGGYVTIGIATIGSLAFAFVKQRAEANQGDLG